MNKVYLVFYKKKRKITSLKTLWYRVADDITKFVAKGIYSHCEIAIKIPDTNLYSCYSSSVRDGGVRNKTMELPEEDWGAIKKKRDSQVMGGVFNTSFTSIISIR